MKLKNIFVVAFVAILFCIAMLRQGHAQTAGEKGCLGPEREELIRRDILFFTSIIMDPGSSESVEQGAYFCRGHYEIQAGLYDAAIADFSRSISLNDSANEDYTERADALEHLGQYALAMKDRDRVVILMPSDPRSYNNRCWTLATWGQKLDNALEDCMYALHLKPDFVDALDSRGFVYFRLRRYQEALKDYGAALKQNPKYASSLYMQGMSKLKLGDLPGGNADVAAAKAIDPKIADTYAGYGITP